MNGCLGRVETMTVDDELISLRNAAEDLGVVEDEAIAMRTATLVEKQSGGKPGEPATDDNAIEDLAGFADFRGNLVELAVAHGMRVLHHALCVAGRRFVVALSGIAAPGRTGFRARLGAERKWASSVQQHAG